MRLWASDVGSDKLVRDNTVPDKNRDGGRITYTNGLYYCSCLRFIPHITHTLLIAVQLHCILVVTTQERAELHVSSEGANFLYD